MVTFENAIQKRIAMSKPKQGKPVPAAPATNPWGVPTLNHCRQRAISGRRATPLIIFMALIKFGNGVAEKSGKEGGTVYARNQYGAYSRKWTKPVYPASTKQLAVNASFGAQSQVWRTLTVIQQAAWAALAATVEFRNRLGETIYLSGQAMFNKLNQNLISAGGTAITVPPLYSVPTAPTSGTGAISLGGGTHTVAYTPTPVPAGVVFQIWATPGQSLGRTAVKGKFRLVANVAAAAASPANIKAAYQAIFGVPVLGATVWYQIKAVNIQTGVESPVIQFNTVVAA